MVGKKRFCLLMVQYSILKNIDIHSCAYPAIVLMMIWCFQHGCNHREIPNRMYCRRTFSWGTTWSSKLLHCLFEMYYICNIETKLFSLWVLLPNGVESKLKFHEGKYTSQFGRKWHQVRSYWRFCHPQTIWWFMWFCFEALNPIQAWGLNPSPQAASLIYWISLQFWDFLTFSFFYLAVRNCFSEKLN